MKKICKYCGSDLFCIKTQDRIGRPQIALYCKSIECGRHNQFGSVKHAHYYEERTSKIEKENMQDIKVHACKDCEYFRPSMKCGFTGSDEKHRKQKCMFFKESV